jgi:hypothetical protein
MTQLMSERTRCPTNCIILMNTQVEQVFALLNFFYDSSAAMILMLEL